MKNKYFALALFAGMLVAAHAKAGRRCKAQTGPEAAMVAPEMGMQHYDMEKHPEMEESVIDMNGKMLTGHWVKGGKFFAYTTPSGETKEISANKLRRNASADETVDRAAGQRSMPEHAVAIPAVAPKVNSDETAATSRMPVQPVAAPVTASTTEAAPVSTTKAIKSRMKKMTAPLTNEAAPMTAARSASSY